MDAIQFVTVWKSGWEWETCARCSRIAERHKNVERVIALREARLGTCGWCGVGDGVGDDDDGTE